MGGATFPTAVKYAPVKEGHRPIDTVLLNGIECEPFVTADHRTLLEYSDEIIQGLKYFMLASGASGDHRHRGQQTRCHRTDAEKGGFRSQHRSLCLQRKISSGF